MDPWVGKHHAYPAAAVEKGTRDVFQSREFQFLQLQFSTGVTLNELASVACVVAHFAHVQGPSREAKRSFCQLVRWFIENWAAISVVLPLVHLRDSNCEVIDARREMREKKCR